LTIRGVVASVNQSRVNWSMQDSNFMNDYAGDGVSSLEIFGVQISPGSTTTLANSYIQNPSVTGVAASTADVVSFTIPSGVSQLIYTFDDNSTQTVGATPGAYTIPTNLNRPWIKTIALK
jgi:hypothetical protein